MADLPTWNTWDGGTGVDGFEPPRRPSLEDMGGADKLDNDDAPPNPREHFTARDWNQKAQQHVALARVAASCKIEVRYNSGAPYVSRCPAAGSNVSPATFTVVDNGSGDTTITWPANTFPTAECSPTGLTPLSSSAQPCTGQVQEISNGIRVRMFQNGSAADVAFTIEIN